MAFANRIMLIGALVLLLPNCDDHALDGGPCYYHEIPGTATIVSVVESEGTTYCDVPVVVRFDFVPDEPQRYTLRYVNVYPIENVRYLVGDGKNPPRRWIESIGFEAGSEHRCVRCQIYEGTCTGAYYYFLDVLEESLFDSCDVWE